MTLFAPRFQFGLKPFKTIRVPLSPWEIRAENGSGKASVPLTPPHGRVGLAPASAVLPRCPAGRSLGATPFPVPQTGMGCAPRTSWWPQPPPEPVPWGRQRSGAGRRDGSTAGLGWELGRVTGAAPCRPVPQGPPLHVDGPTAFLRASDHRGHGPHPPSGLGVQPRLQPGPLPHPADGLCPGLWLPRGASGTELGDPADPGQQLACEIRPWGGVGRSRGPRGLSRRCLVPSAVTSSPRWSWPRIA